MSEDWINALDKYAAPPQAAPTSALNASPEPEATAPSSADDMLSALDHYSLKDAGARATIPTTQPVNKDAEPPQWSDLPGNIIPSGVAAAKNIVYPVLHPVEAAKGVYKIATDPKARAAVADFYKDRYGGLENLHDTLIRDPVGVASDLATVLAGGEFAVGKVAATTGRLGAVADALGTASSAVNPINAAGKVISVAGSGAGKLAKYATGATTLAGPKAVGEAFAAGQSGSKPFLQNMRGNVAPEKVLDDVDAGLQKIKKNAQADYRKNFPASSAPIDTTPVHAAYTDFADSLKTPGGKIKVGDDEWSKIEGVKKAIDDFTGHNMGPTDVFELDGLRQKLSAMYPDGYKYNQLQRGIAAINDRIKSTINATHPEYGPTLGRYSDAMEAISDIKKTLSVNNTAGVGAKMRKLGGILSGDAEGNRAADLVGQLEAASGKPIMSQMAGQKLSGWLPGGGKITPAAAAEAVAMGGAALAGHPAALLAAPFASPRLMGEGAYLAGRASRLAGAVPIAGAALTANEISQPLNAANETLPPEDILRIQRNRAKRWALSQ